MSVLGVALALAAVPATAEPEVPEPEVAALASWWELVGDLWSGITAILAPQSQEAVTVPEDQGVVSAGQCELVCGEQSHDIDPNG